MVRHCPPCLRASAQLGSPSLLDYSRICRRLWAFLCGLLCYAIASISRCHRVEYTHTLRELHPPERMIAVTTQRPFRFGTGAFHAPSATAFAALARKIEELPR